MKQTNPTKEHREQARERLKPCPFCGGEGILLEDDVSEYPADGKFYHVSCLDSCSVAPGVYAQATAEEATRKWNARPEPNAPCGQHRAEYTVFHVGGCLKCWSESETASALSSRDAKVREVLEGLRMRSPACWCDPYPVKEHAKQCLAAQALYAKLQPGE